jgi:hypothetical protein
MNLVVNHSDNEFVRKLFDRVQGLLAIIITDEEGTMILKGISPRMSSHTTVKDFDTAFSATFLLASEQVCSIVLDDECMSD